MGKLQTEVFYMAACKKYTNQNGAVQTYRERPQSDCQNCAFFNSKNCGAHVNPDVNMI